MRTSRFGRFLKTFVTVLVFSVLAPATAFAYLDPMAGSLALQAVVAGLLGAAVTLSGIGTRIRSVARRIFNRLRH